MLFFNETMDHFAMSISVRWYGLVLRNENGHFFRRGLDFVVEG